MRKKRFRPGDKASPEKNKKIIAKLIGNLKNLF